jgi:hypothetical protein
MEGWPGLLDPQQPPPQGGIGLMDQPATPPRPDLTHAFNTPVPPERQADYQQWLEDYAIAHKRPNVSGEFRDYDLAGLYMSGALPLPGHSTDRFKKPSHPTFSEGSQYSGAVAQGGEWLPQIPRAGDLWTFNAAPDNLRMWSEPQLRAYFDREERRNTLNLPQR